MTRMVRLVCFFLSIVAVTLCSCKHLPQPLAELDSTAAAETTSLEAPQSLEPPSHSSKLMSNARAHYSVPVGQRDADFVQRLSHQEQPNAPSALAPVVTAPNITPLPSPAPSVIPGHESNPSAGPNFTWTPRCNCPPGDCRCQTRPPHHASDEYLCDGGDINAKVRVLNNFDVQNIDRTDTVGHFDTLDGQRLVEASNRVCIYAPRFASVRRVDRLFSEDALRGVADIDHPIGVSSQDRHALVGSLLQPIQPVGQLGALAANALSERDRGMSYANTYMPLDAANPLPAFENFEIIQRGVFLNSEKPRLQEHVDAALAWMSSDSVEVMINERLANAVESTSRAQETVVYEMDGKPRLRICKVASTNHAQPGDIIDFTIRFDNVGDQKMGNVTILDSLTTRLEYVEGSQVCSAKADFFTVANDGDSLVLRWEVIAPLTVGEGGVVRFKCRVR